MRGLDPLTVFLLRADGGMSSPPAYISGSYTCKCDAIAPPPRVASCLCCAVWLNPALMQQTRHRLWQRSVWIACSAPRSMRRYAIGAPGVSCSPTSAQEIDEMRSGGRAGPGSGDWLASSCGVPRQFIPTRTIGINERMHEDLFRLVEVVAIGLG